MARTCCPRSAVLGVAPIPPLIEVQTAYPPSLRRTPNFGSFARGEKCGRARDRGSGYRIHPSRKLRPSTASLRRLMPRARRLYEQGADPGRLRRYVTRWTCWLWGGLDGQVCRKGGLRHYLVFVLKQLLIS